MNTNAHQNYKFENYSSFLYSHCFLLVCHKLLIKYIGNCGCDVAKCGKVQQVFILVQHFVKEK